MSQITMMGAVRSDSPTRKLCWSSRPRRRLQLFDAPDHTGRQGVRRRLGLPIAATPGPWLGDGDFVLICTPGTVCSWCTIHKTRPYPPGLWSLT